MRNAGLAERLGRPLDRPLGGPARTKAVVLLASVLALESADIAAVGALATELEHSLGIGDAEVGLLVTGSTLLGAVATIPAGVLTDRVNRVRLLSISIVFWAGAMVVSGLAGSFLVLLLSRLALGAVTATTGPAVASLTGDLFPAEERGSIYGYILAGQLAGAGVGFLVAGNIAAVASWRVAFWALALPALALAVVLSRSLPEPARGGASRLRPGAQRLVPAEEAYDGDREDPSAELAGKSEEHELVKERVAEAHIAPDPDIVLHQDLERMNLWTAIGYVLRVRTNVLIIVSSALGYFYLGGLQTFAVKFLRGRYDLGQSAGSTLLVAIGAGALVGVLVGGRLADALLRRGHLSSRPLVAAGAYLVATALFLPGLLAPSLLVAIPLLLGAVAALAASNPPLDAARLDIIPGRLWGRAESVRTALRAALVAFGPLLFGLVSEAFGGQSGGLGGGRANEAASPAAGRALMLSFSVMLVTLAAAGVVLLWSRRTYPVDVASAAATESESEPLSP